MKRGPIVVLMPQFDIENAPTPHLQQSIGRELATGHGVKNFGLFYNNCFSTTQNASTIPNSVTVAYV